MSTEAGSFSRAGGTTDHGSAYINQTVPLEIPDTGTVMNAICGCASTVPYPVRPATDGLVADIASDEWGFVAPAVHQLRTPLTSILSFSDLLISGNGSEADRSEWIGHIRSQALRMKSSLNSFLSVSEIETGRLVLRPTAVDVETICNDLIKVTAAVAPDVRIQSNISPSGRWVRADEPRFQEIIWNLVDNAVKYSAGGGIVTITSAIAEPGMVRIEISDSGAGIPEEKLADLFKPFHRAVGERGAAKGTGLGLYIVKALAEMHLGYVNVASEPGEGTTFSVTLPLAEDETQQPSFQYVEARPAAGDRVDAVNSSYASVIQDSPISEGTDNVGTDGEFMRWISYELRAPLTPLLAAAELLAEPSTPEIRRSQWLRRIRSLAVRMKCVTDATMTASLLRSGTVSFSPKPFDVISAFATVIGQTAPLVEGHRLSMNTDMDARDVIGDQHRITDVISALIESAARECTDDSAITLNAHRMSDGDRVSVCVSFTAQQKERRDNDDEPTSALGLRVAAQLAQLQGGTVDICATPSGLTSFRTTLASA